MSNNPNLNRNTMLNKNKATRKYSLFYNKKKSENIPIESEANPFSQNQTKKNIYQNNDFNQINKAPPSRRYTISAFPFPKDTPFDTSMENNSLNIQPNSKINKVTKIQPKKQKLNNKITIEKKLNNKDAMSEKLPKMGNKSMNENLGNSINNQNIKINSDIKSVNNLNSKKKILNDNSDDNSNKIIEQKKINNQLKNKNSTANYNKSNNNNILHNSIKVENLKNQFINRNLSIASMLKKINFFENLDKIHKTRIKLLEAEYQNDPQFNKKNFYESIFINSSEIDKISPLTIIFQYLYNPMTKISQMNVGKNFYESVLQLHGYKNVLLKYDINELNKVPKYFKDINYINNLYNNFNEKNLNLFVYEIKNWSKVFNFEVTYEDNNNENIKFNDKIKIYFISPFDIIADYYSYQSNSNESFAEFNFHNDINYDTNKGRFTFKTYVNIYYKCKVLSQLEFLGEIWERALNVIQKESEKNKLIMNKIFKDNVKKNLNKFSTSVRYVDIDKSDEAKKEEKYDDSSNLCENTKDNIDESSEAKPQKNLLEELNSIKKENDINKNKNIEESKNEIIESDKPKNKISENINNKNKKNEQLLFYGVLLSFFIFIFKTILSIEKGPISLEIFFNLLIIIIIGYMLLKNHILDKND